MTEKKQLFPEVLLFLAEFYKPPTEEFYYTVHAGTPLGAWKELFPEIGDRLMSSPFQTFEQMKRAYLQTFIGPGEPFAPPIESLYKQWTEDRTAAVSFAGQKGYLFGDPALHALYLYREFELELPEEYQSMPDHLTLLLEFLVLLIENGSHSQVNIFIKDHFDWLDDYIAELEKADRNGYFLKVTRLVNQLVHSYPFDKFAEQADIERSE